MTAFTAVIAAGILVAWVPHRWTWHVEQVLVFALAAISVWRRGHAGVAPLHALLAAAAAWAAFQLAAGVTVYRWATADAALLWFTWAVCAWVASSLDSERAIASLGWFGGGVSIAAILGEFTAPGKAFWLFDTGYDSRVMGPFVNPNQYAAFIALTLPAMLVQARASWPAAAMAALMGVSVLVGGSVAGTAIVAFETVTVLWLMRRRRDQIPPGKSRIALLALFVILFAAVTGWSTLAARFDRTQAAVERASLTKSTIRMAMDRPVTGWGLGTWSQVYPAYAAFDTGHFDNQAHNDWAQWAAEGGLPFLFLMIAITAVIARPAWDSIHGIGLLFVLLHCLGEYHFQQRPAFGALYFAVAGAVSRPRR